MFYGVLDQLYATGPDVSSVQGALNRDHWVTLEQTNYFAIIKCGNGNDGSDPIYSQNIINARNAGLTVGTYHFVYVLPNAAGHPGRSPEEQAEAHKAKELWHDGDMITWADFEWPYPDRVNGQNNSWDDWGLPVAGRSDFIADFILRYTSHYTEITGRPIGFYSFPYWIYKAGLAKVDRKDEIAALPLWIAGPYKQVLPSSMPDPLAPWTECAFYQWTNTKDGLRTLMPNGAPADWNMCKISTLSALTSSAAS
jgi:hypothetical protein